MQCRSIEVSQIYFAIQYKIARPGKSSKAAVMEELIQLYSALTSQPLPYPPPTLVPCPYYFPEPPHLRTTLQAYSCCRALPCHKLQTLCQSSNSFGSMLRHQLQSAFTQMDHAPSWGGGGGGGGAIAPLATGLINGRCLEST